MRARWKWLLTGLLVFPLVLAGSPAFAFVPAPPITPGSLQSYELGVPGGLLGAAQSSPAEGAESAGEATYDFEAGEAEFEPPASAGSSPSSAGGLLLGADILWGMRGGIAQGVDSVFGINASQTVCSASSSLGGWAELVQEDGDDTCPSIAQQNEDFVQNALESGVPSGGKACDDTGAYCVQFDSNAGYFAKGFYCVSTSGLGTGTAQVIVDYGGSSSAVQLPFTSGETTGNGYCTEGAVGGSAPDVQGDLSVGAFEPNPPVDYCVFAPGETIPLPVTCAGDPLVQSVGNSKSDPPRTLRCDVDGTDGHIYQASSASFLESAGVFPNPVCPALPATVQPTDTKIWEVTSGEPDQLLDDLPSTSAFNDWAATSPATCLTGGCVLGIYSVTGSPQTDCNANPDVAGCADWFTDPTRSADWQCEYNGVVEDMSNCYVLSQFYKPASLTSGDLYADPLTGAPEDGSSPVPGTVAPGTAVADPESSRACFPSGWGALNPVAWVLQPVTCALQWAFVPRQSVIKQDGKNFKKAVQASAVGAILGVISGMATFPITGDGCEGIKWEFQIYSLDKTVYLLAACPGDPLAATAGVVKTILTAVVITIGVLSSARYVASIFGYLGYGGIVDAERRQEYRDEAKERSSRGSGVRFR
jgi:hypothetical protein